MMFTVTPSNSPASAPGDKPSASIAPAIAVDMLNIFAMLRFLPVSSTPRAATYLFLGRFEPSHAQAGPARLAITRLSIDKTILGAGSARQRVKGRSARAATPGRCRQADRESTPLKRTL